MLDVFQIPDDELVTGATRVQNPQNAGAVVDLSRLNPASRSTAPQSAAAGRPRSASVGAKGSYASLRDAETVRHTFQDCARSQQVWELTLARWRALTGENRVKASDPRVVLLGDRSMLWLDDALLVRTSLRPQP